MKCFFKKLLICALCFVCCGCGSNTMSDPWNTVSGPWNYTDTAMGTVMQQGLYCREEETAQKFSQNVERFAEELEQEMLSWRLETSEVYGVNASAGSMEGYPLSEELAELLRECIALSEASEGAFDVTLGPVVRLRHIDSWALGTQTEGFRVPAVEELEQALNRCGSELVRLEAGEDGQEKVYLQPGMQLDFGAVGKGFARTGIQALQEEQTAMTGAVISVGGSVLTYGRKPDGTSWKVGVVNPFAPSSFAGVLSLQGQWFVSTSGDYERYVEADGRRYHHILDPATGYPADSGVCSVTILSEDGMLSDGLSTACFILGPEKGMALAGAYGAEALFIRTDGDVIMSDGMKQYWTSNMQ